MGAEGGFSAAKAKHITRRVKKEPLIAPAAKYTVIDGNTMHTGTFKVVAMLCPGIAVSTLKRRLDNGERDCAKLRRAPEPKQGHKRRNPLPYNKNCQAKKNDRKR